MASTNEAVMQLVQDELEANPDASNQELYEKAIEADKEIKKLSLRQFNARYPLQVKRRQKAASEETVEDTTPKAEVVAESVVSTPRRARRRKSEPDRNSIREALIEFAKAIASAESKSDVVDVIGDVDAYVDKVVGAVR